MSYPGMNTFRDSSMVERLPVKEMVAGSSPAPGAKKLDTNSFFEDESVRSAFAKATADRSLRDGRAVALAGNEADFNAFGGINFFFFKN